MKTLAKQALSIVCLSSALMSCHVLAGQGGVIHFVGSIVEDPCTVTPHQQNISMNCYRSGQNQTSQLSYQQVGEGKTVNNDTASLSMHYLNPQKTLGIVTIAYK